LGPKGRSSEAEELGIGGYEYTEGRKDDPLKCHKWALESLENKTPPQKKGLGIRTPALQVSALIHILGGKG
jgi:hypothetical protein